jgi:hypothetical protein
MEMNVGKETTTEMRIARGLKQSYKNARELTLDETKRELDLRTDCYEVLNEGFNRLYLDIDGSAPASATQKDFDALREETLAKIDEIASGREIAVMESSRYESRKISFRVVFPTVKTFKKDNKSIASHLGKSVTMPTGVRIDLAPYGANQKMRMLGQNKDGENRPLVLVRGEMEDTFISLVPDECELAEVPEEPKKKMGRPRKVVENTLIGDILAEIDLKRIDDYEMWLQMGFICFNESVDVGVWEKASERSTKYRHGDCDKKWKTFTKGHLGIAKLWLWLKEDNPDAYDRLKNQDYAFRKEVFEQNHVKLRNPCRYLRIADDGITQLVGTVELRHIYGSEMCGGKPFIEQWIDDPDIYTCERMEFKPKQEATQGFYNLWTDFAIQPEEGDWSPVKELMWDLSGHKQDIYDYFECYFAHLFQKPYEKPEVMIILSSPEEGIGKDTLGDAVISPILGDKYYVSTTNHEDDVFGRFTSQFRTTLFLKLEEMERECSHKNNDKLKGWITCDKRDYEEKGLPKGTPLKSYVRLFGTTNDPCPVILTKDFRRYLLVNPSSDHVGDKPYWLNMYRRLGYEGKTLVNNKVQAAFLHHCLNVDISNWNPRTKLDTDALVSARQSQAPPHARWFQTQIQFRMDDDGNLDPDDEMRNTFRHFKEQISAVSKYPYTDYKLREELRVYPQVCEPKHTRGGTEWTFNLQQVKNFLVARNWWVTDT